MERGKNLFWTSLVAPWLRICAPKVEGVGSVPGWGGSNMLHGTARNLKKFFLILFWIYEIFCSCTHNVTNDWKRQSEDLRRLTVRVSDQGHRYIMLYRIAVFSYVIWDCRWLLIPLLWSLPQQSAFFWWFGGRVVQSEELELWSQTELSANHISTAL